MPTPLVPPWIKRIADVLLPFLVVAALALFGLSLHKGFVIGISSDCHFLGPGLPVLVGVSTLAGRRTIVCDDLTEPLKSANLVVARGQTIVVAERYPARIRHGQPPGNLPKEALHVRAGLLFDLPEVPEVTAPHFEPNLMHWVGAGIALLIMGWLLARLVGATACGLASGLLAAVWFAVVAVAFRLSCDHLNICLAMLALGACLLGFACGMIVDSRCAWFWQRIILVWLLLATADIVANAFGCSPTLVRAAAWLLPILFPHFALLPLAVAFFARGLGLDVFEATLALVLAAALVFFQILRLLPRHGPNHPWLDPQRLKAACRFSFLGGFPRHAQG